MMKDDFELVTQAEADRRAGLVKNRLAGQSSSPMTGLSLATHQRLNNYSLSGLVGLAKGSEMRGGWVDNWGYTDPDPRFPFDRLLKTENKKLLLLGD